MLQSFTRTFIRTFTRKALTVSTLCLPMISLMAHSALADKASFYVENQSAVAVTELYLSDSSLENWDNDLLEESILDTGDRITVNFSDPSPDRCLYDIKAVFADGTNLEDFRINVCTNDQYQFFDQ